MTNAFLSRRIDWIPAFNWVPHSRILFIPHLAHCVLGISHLFINSRLSVGLRTAQRRSIRIWVRFALVCLFFENIISTYRRKWHFICVTLVSTPFSFCVSIIMSDGNKHLKINYLNPIWKIFERCKRCHLAVSDAIPEIYLKFNYKVDYTRLLYDFRPFNNCYLLFMLTKILFQIY